MPCSKCLSGVLWAAGWINRPAGLKVEEHEQHRNPVTRKTACDSQELILLIAQTYLITVWSQGILCPKGNIPRRKTNTPHAHRCIASLPLKKKKRKMNKVFVEATMETEKKGASTWFDTFALKTDVLIAVIKRGHSPQRPHTDEERNSAASVWKQDRDKRAKWLVQ